MVTQKRTTISINHEETKELKNAVSEIAKRTGVAVSSSSIVQYLLKHKLKEAIEEIVRKEAE